MLYRCIKDIEAIKWTGSNKNEVEDFLKIKKCVIDENKNLIIPTNYGDLKVEVKSYITKNNKHGVDVHREKFFENIYSPVKEETDIIYQMGIYYGALLNGKVIYSSEILLEDCRKFPESINEKTFKYLIKTAINSDNLNPDDFEIRYLTKEEYENRDNKENEKVSELKINNK